jgi:hypothetical protein
MAWTVRRGPGGGPVLAIIFAALFVVVLISVFLGIVYGSSAFPFVMAAPFCIFLLIIIVIIALAAAGYGRRAVPPPPPIQQPMVPAGAQGPVALNCPNCGAPPSNVDRFGVATCSYCNTRYLVR